MYEHGDGAPAALFAPRILQKRVHVGRLHLFVRPVDAGEASDGVVQEGSVRPVEGHPKQARGFRTLGTGGVERRSGGGGHGFSRCGRVWSGGALMKKMQWSSRVESVDEWERRPHEGKDNTRGDER